MEPKTKKSLNAAICCLEYLQADLGELGVEKAVHFLDCAIQEISDALPDTETQAKIIHIGTRQRKSL